jgi:hypothetical protein
MSIASVAVVLVAACGGKADVSVSDTRPAAALDDHVVLAAADVVYRVPTDGGTPRHWAGAVAAADRSSVVAATWRDDRTAVTALDASDRVLWSDSIPGEFGVRIVSSDGRLAALGPGAATGTAYTATGRTSTDLVVLGAGPRYEVTLAGNYEPEAFTVDGDAVILIEYTPPSAPTSYSIVRLDIATNALTPVTDVDGTARPPMRGTARTTVANADGTRLYTYYAAPDGALVHGRVHHAFVHVLDLEEEWAHCIGLDAPFGSFDAAIGLDAAGRTLVVGDVTNGVVAAVDTEALHVEASAALPVGVRQPDIAPSVAVGTDRAYVTVGNTVHALDVSRLTAVAKWSSGPPVLALRVDGSGTRLYASVPERIVVLDPNTMRAHEWLEVPGAADVRTADPRTRPVGGARDELQCAC